MRTSTCKKNHMSLEEVIEFITAGWQLIYIAYIGNQCGYSCVNVVIVTNAS